MASLVRKPYFWLIIFMIAVGALIALFGYLNRSPLSVLAELDVSPPPNMRLAILDGDVWTPGVLDPEGFAFVAENDRYALSLAPETSWLKIVDKQTGHVWRSNPPAGKLTDETVKGLLLENLQSVFLMEYSETGKISTNITNTLDPEMTIHYIRNNDTIQAVYEFEKSGISITLQFELTGTGLAVRLPSAGIAENGDYHLISIRLLPFLGAAAVDATDGYLFVPDGPGGLIHFNHDRPAIGKQYNYPLLNSDYMAEGFEQDHKNPLLYPVFGLKENSFAFIAIVEDGKYATRVNAFPSGTVSTFHSISAEFVYRELYDRKLSRLSPPVKTFEEQMNGVDHSVEYRFLTDEKADYVGMAQEYRSYLAENQLLPTQAEPVANIPLQLEFVGGDTRIANLGGSYVPVTTFNQAEKIVSDLVANGIANMTVIYKGWANRGGYEADKRFPIENSLGGQQAAEDFVEQMHNLGFKVLFADQFAFMDKHAKISSKSSGVIRADRSVFVDKQGNFILNPVEALRLTFNEIDRLEKIGVDGIRFDDIGWLMFSDYNSDRKTSREAVAYYYRSVLQRTQKYLGMAAITDGNADLSEGTDWIADLPLDSSYDYTVDETVPFYPIVLHGHVIYSGKAGNMRNEYKFELLKSIEYGALPWFVMTYDSPRKLKDSLADTIFSSEYSVWKDRILEEYADLNKLAKVYDKEIIDHQKISDDIYATTYSDGTKVTVNYATYRFAVEGGDQS